MKLTCSTAIAEAASQLRLLKSISGCQLKLHYCCCSATSPGMPDSTGRTSHSVSSNKMPCASQQSEDEEFHDPCLQYIRHLLMNEDIDDRKCTLHESIALQATVKSFSDILNTSNQHLLKHNRFSCDEDFRVLGEEPEEMQRLRPAEDHALDMVMRLDERQLIPTGFSLHQGKISLRSQSFGGQTTLDVGSGHPERRSASELDHGYVEILQTTNDSTKHGVFTELFKQLISNGSLKQNVSNHILKKDILGGRLKQHVSEKQQNGCQNQNVLWYSDTGTVSQTQLTDGSLKQNVSNDTLKQHIVEGRLKQHVSEKEQDGCQNQNILWYSDTGSVSQSQLAKRHYPFNSSIEESLLSSASQVSTNYNSRLKSSVGSTQPGAKGNSPLSSDDEVGNDNNDVESLSFVGNEDLKADLTSLLEKLRNSGLKPSLAPRTGKSKTIHLATTVDLINMLHSCAQAVADYNTQRANEILRDIRQEASPYGNDIQRLAHYFGEGLFARITGTGAVVYKALSNSLSSTDKILKAHRMMLNVSPFPKLSHVFTSRVFVEAAKGAGKLHIIDYGIWYGIQWPGVISALAERKGGPPYLRMTIIEYPQLVDSPANRAEWTGQKLSEYARAYGVPFEYHVIADKWENITASTVGLREEEVVLVHSALRLRHVLDESVTLSNPRMTVLKNILEMNPKLFFQGIVNCSYTSPFFLPRFREALSSFSTFFNIFETIAPCNSQERLLIEREFLGREILNVLACEGEERVERPETYKQWQSRINRVGFVQIPLDENMVKHFQSIGKAHYNKNFHIDMDENWLLFGWKGKVTKAFTLWRPRMVV